MSNTSNPYRQRYHRTDGWRGYPIPARAVAGASMTGDWEDSPCPTKPVLAEVERFRKEVLRTNGIRSRLRYGETSNVFCGKVWVVIQSHGDFDRAARLSAAWLREHDHELDYLHSADLDAVGYTGEPDTATEAQADARPSA